MRPFVVVALSLALFSCEKGGGKLVQTLPPDLWVDTYAQQSASKVDVLWVVDNSFSMVDKQANLARNFQSFIDLFSKGKVDFRIGVTTTDIFNDAGQLRGSPKVLKPSTPNLAAAFGTNIKVGTAGSAYEAGLQAAHLALQRWVEANKPQTDQVEACRQTCAPQSNPLECQAGCAGKYPVDFLRPDAFLNIVFVTDEEDRSETEVRYFWRDYKSKLGVGNDATVTTASIVGRSKDNSCNANVGSRYLELSALTGGEVGDICDAEFATTLKRLATSAVGLKRKFALTRLPNPETIEIFLRYRCDVPAEVLSSCASVDAVECEGRKAEDKGNVCTPVKGGNDGWSWDPVANLIYFSGSSVPYLEAEIELRYYLEGVSP